MEEEGEWGARGQGKLHAGSWTCHGYHTHELGAAVVTCTGRTQDPSSQNLRLNGEELSRPHQ